MTESENLNKIAEKYSYAKGVMQFATAYCGEIFLKYLQKDFDDILELGPAEGVMTEILYPHFKNYTAVDGGEIFVQNLKERYPKIQAHVSLFEDFVPPPADGYHNIILGHVLEHVENPVQILKLCKTWLADGGRIISAVPNANSIHRQAAVLMGLLNSTKQLNETDKSIGHRRVYDLETLKSDFLQADLKIIHSGGYWLKPVSNAQIEKDWTSEMVNAFLKLGEKYPDIAGEIFIVATK